MIKRIILISGFIALALSSFAQAGKDMATFIDKLMSQMTLEEKIGQLNLPVSNSFIAGERKAGEMTPLEKRIAKAKWVDCLVLRVPPR